MLINNIIEFRNEQCHGKVHAQKFAHTTSLSIYRKSFDFQTIVEQNKYIFFQQCIKITHDSI